MNEFSCTTPSGHSAWWKTHGKKKKTILIKTFQVKFYWCWSNYFKSSVHDSYFLACEFRQSTEVFKSDGYGLRKCSTCRLKLINHLFNGTVWWCCHFLWWALILFFMAINLIYFSVYAKEAGAINFLLEDAA